jgi:hypothetical protein
MTLAQLEAKYRGKSVPEFVNGTWLGRDISDKLVACEGISPDGFEYCRGCQIREYCYLRLNDKFYGG